MKKNKIFTMAIFSLTIITISTIGFVKLVNNDTNNIKAVSVIKQRSTIWAGNDFESEVIVTMGNKTTLGDEIIVNAYSVIGEIKLKNSISDPQKAIWNNKSNWGSGYLLTTKSGTMIGNNEEQKIDFIAAIVDDVVYFTAYLPLFDIPVKVGVAFDPTGNEIITTPPDDLLEWESNALTIDNIFDGSGVVIYPPMYSFNSSYTTNTVAKTITIEQSLFIPQSTRDYYNTIITRVSGGGVVSVNNAPTYYLDLHSIDKTTIETFKIDSINSIYQVQHTSNLAGNGDVYYWNPYGLIAPSTRVANDVTINSVTDSVTPWLQVEYIPVDSNGNKLASNPDSSNSNIRDGRITSKLIQPFYVDNLDSSFTQPTSSSTKDGRSDLTFYANSASSTNLSVSLNGRNGFSHTVDFPITNNASEIQLNSTGLGIGFYTYTISSNLVLSSTTTNKIQLIFNAPYLEQAGGSIVPIVENTTKIISNTLVGEIKFIGKTTGTGEDLKTSILDQEQSRVFIYYNNVLIQKEVFTPVLTKTDSFYSYTFDASNTTLYPDQKLFSVYLDVFYLIQTPNGTIPGDELDSGNIITTPDSDVTVNPNPINENSGLPAGIIIGIVISSLAAVGLIAMFIVSSNNKKKKGKLNSN